RSRSRNIGACARLPTGSRKTARGIMCSSTSIRPRTRSLSWSASSRSTKTCCASSPFASKRSSSRIPAASANAKRADAKKAKAVNAARARKAPLKWKEQWDEHTAPSGTPAVFPPPQNLPLLRSERAQDRLQGRQVAAALHFGARQDRALAHHGGLRQ